MWYVLGREKLHLFDGRVHKSSGISAREIKQMRMVNNSVNNGGGEFFVEEDLVPFGKLQICGNNKAFAFVAVGDNAEKKFRQSHRIQIHSDSLKPPDAFERNKISQLFGGC